MEIAFDWTISLGQVINALIVLVGMGLAAQRIYHVLDKRVFAIEQRVAGIGNELKDLALSVEKQIAGHVQAIQHQIASHASTVERQINSHSKTLEDHATRMERWESALFKVVSDLQRVIGRMEIGQDRRWDGTDRRNE